MVLPFIAEHSKVLFSESWLIISILIIIYCENQLLWWAFADALTYGYKDKNFKHENREYAPDFQA